MERTKMIPYSVHLPEDVYLKLKAAAGARKASALVRDAITIIINGDDEFNGGYNKAIADAMNVVDEEPTCARISVDGISIAERINSLLVDMIILQNTKAKNAKKKA